MDEGDEELPENVTPLGGRPEFTWRITREPGGCLAIETVNRFGGVGEFELWCTVEQARELGALLVKL